MKRMVNLSKKEKYKLEGYDLNFILKCTLVCSISQLNNINP